MRDVKMKIFKIWQEVNDGYDTYSDAIVIAEDEEQARRIIPGGKSFYELDSEDNFWFIYADGKRKNEGPNADHSWCAIKDVQVEYIGEAKEGSEIGVVCASFHAG